MSSAVAPCVCTSDVCGHESGKRCGQPVKVKLKMSIALGESNFGQEFETGICEGCWDMIKKHYPELFPQPAVQKSVSVATEARTDLK